MTHGQEAHNARQQPHVGGTPGAAGEAGYGHPHTFDFIRAWFVGQVRAATRQEPFDSSVQSYPSGPRTVLPEPDAGDDDAGRTGTPQRAPSYEPPTPQPRARAAPTQPRTADGVTAHLERIKQCESGGDYTINTGNGFYGAYQFTLSTWQSQGGTGYPHEASVQEQDARAYNLYVTSGPQHWPVCQYR